MLKFLFGQKTGPVAKIETQRETFVRLAEELNEAIAAMADKPEMTLNLNTGGIEFKLPDQFPDEALALPAPVKEEEEKTAEAA